jgi:hypothetical protein
MKQSARWHWNKADTLAWLNQAWKVLIPYLVVIIPVLIGQIPKEWGYAGITIYILNRIWDAARRWYQGPVK